MNASAWKRVSAFVAFVFAGILIEKTALKPVDVYLKEVRSEVQAPSANLHAVVPAVNPTTSGPETRRGSEADTRPVARATPLGAPAETRPTPSVKRRNGVELVRELLARLSYLTATNRATNTAEMAPGQVSPTYEAFALSVVKTDPVSPTTGEAFYNHLLVALPGVGLDFSFSLSYRSGFTYDGPVGSRWEHNWNARFQYSTTGGTTKLIRYAGNRVDDYLQSGTTDVFTPPAGFFELDVRRDPNPSPKSVTRLLQDGTLETYELLDPVAEPNWYFLTSVKHRDRDNVIALAYDDRERLTKLTDTRGKDLKVLYENTNSRMTELQDWSSAGGSADRSWKLAYNGDNLESVEAPGSAITSFAYTGANLLESVTAPREYGTSDSFVFNTYSSSKVITQRYGVTGQNFALTYGSNVTTETDREGGRRIYQSTAGGAVTKIRQERSTGVFEDTNFEWNADALTTKVIYPEGNGALYQYTNGQLVASAQASSSSLSTTHTNLSAESSSSSQLVTVYAYRTTSDWRLLTKITDPKGGDWQLARDSLGNVTTYKTPQYPSDPWTMSYDSRSRLISASDPEGRDTDLAYGAQGLLTSVTLDAGGVGAETTFAHDKYGAVTSIEDPRGKVTTLTRNIRGTVATATTPEGRVTDYYYDLNDVLTEVHADVGHADAPNPERQTKYARTRLDVVSAITVKYGSSYASNRIWTLGLDKEDQVTLVTLPHGKDVKTVYDLRGLEVTKTIAYGTGAASSTVTIYDGNGRSVTLKDGNGNATLVAYDAFDRPLTTTDPAGHYRVTVYDENSNVVTTQAKNSGGSLLAETALAYDANNRLTKRRTLAKTDSGTNIGSGVIEATYGFDKSDRQTSKSDPCGSCGGGPGGTTTYEFDGAGRMYRVTDAKGNRVTHDLDAAGMVVKTTSDEVESGSTKTFVVEFAYDDDGRLTSRSLRGGGGATALTTTYEVDATGAVWKVTDPNGNVVRILRDDFGRTTKVRRQLAGGGSPTYLDTVTVYDANDNVLTRTCVRTGGDTHVRYLYDAADRVTTTYDEAGTAESFVYDAAHNVVTRTDRNTTVALCVYDSRNLLVTKNYTLATNVVGPTTIKLSYDGLGRVVAAVNHPDGARIERKWNTLSHVEQEKSWLVPTAEDGTGSTPKTVDYEYDGGGHVTQVKYPDGDFKLLKAYDELGRVTKLQRKEGSSAAVDAAQWTFFGYGRMRGLTLGSDRCRETLTYDAYGRATKLEWDRLKNGTRSTTFDFRRGYDAGGRVSYERRDYYRADTNALIGGDFDYGDRYYYDGVNRLTKTLRGVGRTTNDHAAVETAAENTTDFVARRKYALDEAGNRLTLTYDLSGLDNWRREDHTFNDENQLMTRAVYDWNGTTLTQTGSSTTNTFDANGNQTTGPTNKVDAENRLMEATVGGLTWKYRFDAFGRRIERKETTNGTFWTRTYFDGVVPIQEYVIASGSPPVHSRAKFTRIYGPYMVDQILWARGDLYNDQNYLLEGYFETDYLGSVTYIVSDISNTISTEGGVLETYRYMEYGEVWFCDNLGNIVSTTNSAGDQDLTFTGREWTSEVQRLYYRARWYSPHTGVFDQRDLLEEVDAGSAYVYVDGRPADRIDDDGLRPKIPKLFLPEASNYCQRPSDESMNVLCRSLSNARRHCWFIALGEGRDCLDRLVAECEAKINGANRAAKAKRKEAQEKLDALYNLGRKLAKSASTFAAIGRMESRLEDATRVSPSTLALSIASGAVSFHAILSPLASGVAASEILGASWASAIMSALSLIDVGSAILNGERLREENEADADLVRRNTRGSVYNHMIYMDRGITQKKEFLRAVSDMMDAMADAWKTARDARADLRSRLKNCCTCLDMGPNSRGGAELYSGKREGNK